MNLLVAFRNIFETGRLRRGAAALLLAYQFIFLNVFIPGHTRGAITLDGKHSPETCCCCCCSPQESSDSKSPSAPEPSQRDRANCAVCHFAARIMATPVIDLSPAKLGLLAVLPPPASWHFISLGLVPTYFACGPPPSL
jgi:hypothetical protein